MDNGARTALASEAASARWRDRMAGQILGRTIWLGLLAVVVADWWSLREGNWGAACIFTGLYLGAVVVLWRQRAGGGPHALTLVVLCYLAGTVRLVQWAPQGSGFPMLLVSCVLAALLLERRRAVLAYVVTAATVVVVTGLHGLGVSGRHSSPGIDPAWWLSWASSFVALSLMVFLGTEYVVGRLVRSLDEARRRHSELAESETRYRSLYEGANDAILVLEGDRFIACNPIAMQLFGCAEEELVGRTPMDWSPGFQGDGTASKVLAAEKIRLALEGRPQLFYWTHCRKDGSEFVVEVSLNRVDAGGVPLVLALLRDATKRLRTEELLRQSEERYRKLFMSMQEGFALHEIICDENGRPIDYRYIDVNRAFEEMTGILRERWIGRTVREVLPQVEEHWIDAFGDVALTGRPRSFERYSPEVGRYFDLIVFSPAPRQFAVVLTDMTERKRAQEILVESEKMLSLGGLAAGMAHEINNPLAGMVQNAQVVLSRVLGDLPANREAARECGTTLEVLRAYMSRRGIPEMLEAIRASGLRAAEIVANMLSYSRRNDTKVRLVALGEMLDQTIELAYSDYDMRKRHDLRGIEIVRDYAADLPAIACMVTEIQQVMLNLLKNAVEAMPSRGQRADRPRIVIRTRWDGAMVRIETEDNGPGMPEGVRRRVFEPFFTTKGPQAGTGLGLYVSYFIVTRNHGGTIAVESVEGQGTVFVVCLPPGKPVQ